jgi:hypothetical protein
MKKTIWNNFQYHLLVVAIYTHASFEGMTSKRVLDLKKSWTLKFIDNLDLKGWPKPVFQLMGKPWPGMMANDQAELRKLLKTMDLSHEGEGLMVDKTFTSCVWCKCKMHPAYMCPFPKVDGWLGPILENATPQVKQDDEGLNGISLSGVLDGQQKRDDTSSQWERTNGTNSRGGRGRGQTSRGRGGRHPPKGGWKKTDGARNRNDIAR